MQSDEANRPAKLVIFVGVGVLLLGVTIAGIVFAKNRAEIYANKGAESVAEQQNGPDEPTPPPQEEQAGQNTGDVAGTQTNEPSDLNVPAAGPQDTWLIALSVAVLGFIVAKFWQTHQHQG